ncbi:SnoaL-like domain-containing protein [Roseivirga sp. E12]|uniref:SnoaL-like domain-containing protein n=1 Tax=Roseivirga sp. E12 TaxID=2819237 RepID=UPI001ABC4DF0|nr:SnoaL-like domain-containing protein [Roseivirga sp. E12]MBO3699783.1 nuclear transport factor 2 family protein [Roseivirga sp. E12]
MSILALEQELQTMMGQGQMLEAFDKFYADNVVMVEATGEVREGKAYNREFEIKWLESLEGMHGGGVTAMTSNEETGHTCTETWGDFSFKGGQRMKMEEVSVKKWEDGKVVHERFYYDTKGMG